MIFLLNPFDVPFLREGGPIQYVLLFMFIVTTVIILDQILLSAAIHGRIRYNRQPFSVFNERVDIVYSIFKSTELHSLESLLLSRRVLTRNLNFLELISAISPIAGVLGTVHGIILSFWEIGNTDSPKFGDISLGISHALYTTAFGLGLCFIALIAIWICQNYIDPLLDKIDFLVDCLSQGTE